MNNRARKMVRLAQQTLQQSAIEEPQPSTSQYHAPQGFEVLDYLPEQPMRADMIFCDVNEELPATSCEDITDDYVLCETTGQLTRPVNMNISLISEPDISVTQKIKINKKRRILGKTYIGYKKAKNAKYVHDEKKPAKALGTRCAHEMPKIRTKNSYLCKFITETDRHKMFSSFWALKTWPEKKVYVRSLVTTRRIRKRRNNMPINDRKKKTGHYVFLVNSSGEKYRVCKNFFLNILCIGDNIFKRWSTPSTEESSDNDENIPPVVLSKKIVKKNATEENIRTWLNLLPMVPSHYCRANSNRRYVESSFLVPGLYKLEH